MTLGVLHFVSEASQSGQSVFITSWVELLTIATLGTIIAGLIGAYRHLECHHEKCHKPGRYTHGHLKLCHIHHPLVPNDGNINQDDIDVVTKSLES